jgi:hypothetical protein
MCVWTEGGYGSPNKGIIGVMTSLMCEYTFAFTSCFRLEDMKYNTHRERE